MKPEHLVIYPNRRLPLAIRRYWPWVICSLAAFFYCYEFFLRVAPSVMVQELMQAYHLNAAKMGLLSAFYYCAYTPMQLPVGILMDRYGPRRLLTAAILFCTIGAVMMALGDQLIVASTGRFFMGFGSAFAFVGVLKLAASWLPPERFALASGLTTALGMLGAVGGEEILTEVVHWIGWRNAWWVAGIAGAVLSVLMWIIIRDKPYRVVSRRGIHEASWSHAVKSLLDIMKNPQFWIVGFVGGMLFLPVSVFGALWGPDFLKNAQQMNAVGAATAVSLMFIGIAFGGPIVGWLSDYFSCRRPFLLVGNLGAAIIFSLLITFQGLSVVAIDVLLFLAGLFIGCQVLVFAVGREVSPADAAATAVAGINCIVMLGAPIFQPVVGWLLDNMWRGTIINGAPVYSFHDYSVALSVIPITLIIGFILCFFLHESHTQHN